MIQILQEHVGPSGGSGSRISGRWWGRICKDSWGSPNGPEFLLTCRCRLFAVVWCTHWYQQIKRVVVFRSDTQILPKRLQMYPNYDRLSSLFPMQPTEEGPPRQGKSSLKRTRSLSTNCQQRCQSHWPRAGEFVSHSRLDGEQHSAHMVQGATKSKVLRSER